LPVVLTVVFLLIHLVPGDPVEQMCSWPLSRQLAHGVFGQSFKFQAPVRSVIFCEGYPATLQLAFLALVVCAAIAIPSGMLAAAAARRPTALSEGELSE